MRMQDWRAGRSHRGLVMAMLACGVAVAGAATPVSAAGAATTWSPPVTLATVPGTPSPALVTAGQASGTAVVAWTDTGVVKASVRTPSAGWSRAVAVSPAGQTATSLAVVLRPDGSAVLAWQAQQAPAVVIESAVWTPAAGWSAPVVVSGTATAGNGLALGVDGAGNTLAVWGQYNPATLAISVASATLPAAGPWSAPVILATPAGSAVRQVSVAVNSAGAAVVGWIRKFNSLYGDVVTRPAGGAFGTPVTIATGPWRPALQQLHSLQVAIDATGRASAVWNNSFANASAQQADGTWAPATVFPMGYASNPALAADATGTAQMLWAVGGAQASSLPPGGSWSTPATAVFPGAKPLDLGIAPNGTSDFAGWYDTGTSKITAAVHTSAGWGTPMQVTSALPAPPWVAAVSTAPVGTGALIAWISGTGNPGTVRVSIGS